MAIGLCRKQWRSAAMALCAAMALVPRFSPRAGDVYTQHNMVSNGVIAADYTDADVVDPRGIMLNPTGTMWLANNATGKSSGHYATGLPMALVIDVSSPLFAVKGKPTGVIHSDAKGFIIKYGANSGSAHFLFVGADGVITGWSQAVSATLAVMAVNNYPSGAVYTSLAMARNINQYLLYAADFHNGRIDVFDDEFDPAVAPGQFVDFRMPKGYAPFGIAPIGNFLYVAYAKQDAAQQDAVAGRGLGLVDIFSVDGVLVRRLATFGKLNAPWGMALAPSGFGQFSGCLLVANHGDGTISAYDPMTGAYKGQLRGAEGKRIVIDGLWGLAFGNGAGDFGANTLYFTAGPENGSQGLFGRIELIAP